VHFQCASTALLTNGGANNHRAPPVVDQSRPHHRGFSGSPLKIDGMPFAAKDAFDVAGHVTGIGNSDWLRMHPAAQRTASMIERMSAAGAKLEGKTITDELAYSRRYHG
jgi:amidase